MTVNDKLFKATCGCVLAHALLVTEHLTKLWSSKKMLTSCACLFVMYVCVLLFHYAHIHNCYHFRVCAFVFMSKCKSLSDYIYINVCVFVYPQISFCKSYIAVKYEK